MEEEVKINWDMMAHLANSASEDEEVECDCYGCTTMRHKCIDGILSN